jgi:hypothetical protein
MIIIIIKIYLYIGGEHKIEDSEMSWKHPYKLEWSNVSTLLQEKWIWTNFKPKPFVEDLWVGLRLGDLSSTSFEMSSIDYLLLISEHPSWLDS